MPLGECELKNFGPKHREIFRDVQLDNLYCLKYDDQILKC